MDKLIFATDIVTLSRLTISDLQAICRDEGLDAKGNTAISRTRFKRYINLEEFNRAQFPPVPPVSPFPPSPPNVTNDTLNLGSEIDQQNVNARSTVSLGMSVCQFHLHRQ